MCGKDRAELIGQDIDAFLATESRPVLEKLLAQVRAGVLDEACEVSTSAGAAVHVKAGMVPGESSILMVFVDLANSTKADRRA